MHPASNLHLTYCVVYVQAPNIETTLFERKMDNCKPCGGAIPLCMVDEFKLPPDIIDRRVRKMKMISCAAPAPDPGQQPPQSSELAVSFIRQILSCVAQADGPRGQHRTDAQA